MHLAANQITDNLCSMRETRSKPPCQGAMHTLRVVAGIWLHRLERIVVVEKRLCLHPTRSDPQMSVKHALPPMHLGHVWRP